MTRSERKTGSHPHSPHLPRRLQDLTRTWARFCLDIERTLLSKCPFSLKGTRLLLACSAGSDSLALLMVMHYLSPRLGTRISVAHLDHQLRPESAAESLEIVRLCAELDRPVIVGRCNVRRYARTVNCGLEEAGRILRYRLLFALRRKISADLLLTAHHANDLAEDVLMRLIRGAGWPGLSGMPAWDPDRALIRPLLHTPKESLREFLSSLGLSWHDDPTNIDPVHTRNRIRTDIMPVVLRENPRFLETISRLHLLGGEDAHYFQSILCSLLEQAIARGHALVSSDIRELHPALRLRLYKAVLDDLGAGQVLHDSLRRLDRAWQRKRLGAMIQFPGEKTARITNQGIQFAGSGLSPMEG